MRLHLCNTLKLKATDIKTVFKVASGWGMTPADEEMKKKLVESTTPGLRFEGAERWAAYVVPRVPRQLRTAGGTVQSDGLV